MVIFLQGILQLCLGRLRPDSEQLGFESAEEVMLALSPEDEQESGWGRNTRGARQGKPGSGWGRVGRGRPDWRQSLGRLAAGQEG